MSINPIVDIYEASTSHFPTHEQLADFVVEEYDHERACMAYETPKDDQGEPVLDRIRLVVYENPVN